MLSCSKVTLILAVAWAVFSPTTDAYYYTDRYMMRSSSSCNSGIISVQYDDAGYLQLKSYQSAYARNLHCMVTLDAGSGKRLYLQFDSVSIASGDSVSLYDGSSATSYNKMASVSGTYTSFKRRTSGRYLTIKFDSYSNNYYSYWGFKMIYTRFKSEPCSGDLEFECDNDYCIGESLTCDFINNCGDNSDEGSDGDCYYVWGVGLIIGVVVAILFGLGLIIGGLVCCCVCASRSSRRNYQTVIHTGQVPAPAYGSTTGQQVYPPHYQQYTGGAGGKVGTAASPPPYQQFK